MHLVVNYVMRRLTAGFQELINIHRAENVQKIQTRTTVASVKRDSFARRDIIKDYESATIYIAHTISLSSPFPKRVQMLFLREPVEKSQGFLYM